MLKAISTSENIATIKDLIFRLSPYSVDSIQKFNNIVDRFLTDEHYQHIEFTGQLDTKTVRNITYQKYFLIWRSFDRSKIFAGQLWISEREAQDGLNLRRLEFYTS